MQIGYASYLRAIKKISCNLIVHDTEAPISATLMLWFSKKSF